MKKRASAMSAECSGRSTTILKLNEFESSVFLLNEFSSVYFTGNLSSSAPHQDFCGHLGSFVIICICL